MAVFHLAARVWAQRGLIAAMAWQEVKVRYAGTLAGLAWSVLQPLMLILTYWFVFSVGFRVRPAGGLPFIVVFLCGLIPWTTFAETVVSSATCITSKPYLVKKVAFPTEILPIVQLLSSMVSHGIMLVILLVLLPLNGLPVRAVGLQFLLFLAGMSILAVGLGWLVAALNVFFRDVAQVLQVVMNVWFWLTPIVWQSDMLGGHLEKYAFFLKLNPMYYVVQGYRDSLLHGQPFWQNPRHGLYFWAVALVVGLVGGWVFRRLKPNFPEML